jgi:hypothetical protein
MVPSAIQHDSFDIRIHVGKNAFERVRDRIVQGIAFIRPIERYP